jgi:hypothetical protein
MTLTPPEREEQTPRDAAYWARPVAKLKVATMPLEALNLNVEGRQIAGPLQGFGQLWQKTYRIRLEGAQVTPAKVIQYWKAHFADFWPVENRFYGRVTGIALGEVAVLNLAMPGGMPVRMSTGVMVVYADEESFSFMTPEGHMFASLMTFSAFRDGDCTVVQIQPLIRASDPLYEVGMRLGVIHKVEDRFWHHVLKGLAAHYGVKAEIQQHNECLDPRVQWSEAKNIWHNAAIRSGLYAARAPVRWLRRRLKRSG